LGKRKWAQKSGFLFLLSNFHSLLLLMTGAYTRTDCRKAVGHLTPRQRQVLVKIAACKPRKVIAGELGISQGTLKTHIENIYRRLDIQADTQAVRVACAAGLVPTG
jgi:DNA-binding NarL/FixJ family response regulator